jgi:hypothetical protein
VHQGHLHAQHLIYDESDVGGVGAIVVRLLVAVKNDVRELLWTKLSEPLIASAP